jgi:hypothetical protein
VFEGLAPPGVIGFNSIPVNVALIFIFNGSLKVTEYGLVYEQ